MQLHPTGEADHESSCNEVFALGHIHTLVTIFTLDPFHLNLNGMSLSQTNILQLRNFIQLFRLLTISLCLSMSLMPSNRIIFSSFSHDPAYIIQTAGFSLQIAFSAWLIVATFVLSLWLLRAVL